MTTPMRSNSHISCPLSKIWHSFGSNSGAASRESVLPFLDKTNCGSFSSWALSSVTIKQLDDKKRIPPSLHYYHQASWLHQHQGGLKKRIVSSEYFERIFRAHFSSAFFERIFQANFSSEFFERIFQGYRPGQPYWEL